MSSELFATKDDD